MYHRNAIRQIFVLFILMLGIGLVGNLISMGIWMITGNPVDQMLGTSDMNTSERIIFRLALMVNHIFMFLLPAFIFGYIYYKEKFASFLKMNRSLSIQSLILWGSIILFSYPIVGFLTEWNEKIPFPEWAESSQTNAFQVLKNVLQMDNPLELLLSLLLVGIVPAIGEELIFRGIIQQKLIEAIKRPHLAILLASILFGTIHLQPERVLPLSFLGLLLGYSFYFTRSLLVPVILHFLNNGFQVISLYMVGEVAASDINGIPEIPMSILITSIILTFGLFYYGQKLSKIPDEQ